MSAVIKTSDTGNVAIMSKRTDNSAGSAGWLLGLDYGQGDGVPYFEVSDGTNEFAIYGSTNIADNTWHTISVVFDENSSANTKIYIDGISNIAGSAGTISNIGPIANSVALNVGRTNDGTALFTCCVDRVAF